MALKSIGYGTNILDIDETGSTLFGLYIGYNDNDTIISADLKLWKILFNEKDITKLFEEYEMEECSGRDIVEEPNIIFHIRTKQKDTVVRQDSNGNKRIVLSGYNGIVCFQ